jgi:uncharacterized membrane protein YjgN (DUF898 family)
MGVTVHDNPGLTDNPYVYAGSPASAQERYPIEFTATAGEYFRIWIVNLALTIVTLGIYSAWAKVRKKRYFYGHTLIDGDGFEYRAQPLAILKGRVIAVALFGAYSLAGNVSPILGGVVTLILVFAMPWLIVRSLAFNAHNSAYRNIRFRFDGRYPEMLKLIIGGGLLVIFTLGIGYPYLKARMVAFAANHHAYGTTSFALGKITGAFYSIYAKALAMLILLSMLAGGVAASLGTFADKRSGMPAGFPVFLIAIYAVYLLVYSYTSARTTNATWNTIEIGPLTFESTLGARQLAGIYLTNVIAIICTLGLAIPWAVVRTMRYRAQSTVLFAAGGLANFMATHANDRTATGEEVGEMFGIDFSL